MEKHQIIEKIKTIISTDLPKVEFIKLSSDLYSEMIAEKQFRQFKNTCFLNHKNKTEFERKNIAYICEKLNVTLTEINRFIVDYELREKDIVKDLWPKTKIQLNLFILTRTYELVIILMPALDYNSHDMWQKSWISNYTSEKIVVLEIIATTFKEMGIKF